MIRPLAEARGGVQLWLVELNGHKGVTRLFGDIPQPLRLARAIEGLAFGRSDSAGFHPKLVHHLTGYAVRSRLDPSLRLPVVLAAGLALDPAQPDRGAPFVTASWVEGEPLPRAASGADASTLAGQLLSVLELLESLHALNVVYGDLKPDNIIVSEAGVVSLIDLETVRRVPNPEDAVPATALTPPYAAPEIEHDQLLFLASDVFAFGVTAARLLGEAGLPRWSEAIAACRAPSPADRPTARALLEHLRGVRELPAPSPPERTIRVVDQDRPAAQLAPPRPLARQLAAPDAPRPAQSERLSSDVLSAEIPASPAPPPPVRPARRSRWPSTLLFWGLILVAYFVLTRVMRANELAEDASVALAERQEDPAINDRKDSMSEVYALAAEAVDTWKNAQSTSIFALAEVLESRWHYEGADWDAAAWRRDLAAVEAALEYGENANNRLAAAYLYGGACWRSTDDPELRRQRCQQALIESEHAARLAQPGWQTLEAAWVRAMTFSHMIARLEDSSPEQIWLLQAASQACLDAPASAARGVNGIYLLKECLRIQGRARNLQQYLVAADAYLNLAERQGEDIGEARATALWSVDPVCGERKNRDEVAMTRLRPGRLSADDRGQRVAFCRLVGAKALGCALPNPEEWRPCARSSFRYDYWQGLTPYCAEAATHPAIPWDEALALSPIRPACPVPE